MVGFDLGIVKFTEAAVVAVAVQQVKPEQEEDGSLGCVARVATGKELMMIPVPIRVDTRGEHIEQTQGDITESNLTIMQEILDRYVPRQEDTEAMEEDDDVSVDVEDLTSSTDVLLHFNYLETKVNILSQKIDGHFSSMNDSLHAIMAHLNIQPPQ
ncbi:hypothetical protein F0562_005906 [Nyssa sinensis]|uniref:Uncharacterized protein n=1 Tax=Nyssa sinensis TaxID=561372 RepID=A0A5J5AKK6_9ASTE|nr:hypothetical protein F0562_005906 [Nyssa sinensis]